MCAWLPRQNFAVTPVPALEVRDELELVVLREGRVQHQLASFLAAPIRRPVRSAPWYEATARIPGVGSTAKLAARDRQDEQNEEAKRHGVKGLEPQQARCVLAEDLAF